MERETIKAYDVPARVAVYDADMDLMHPNRHKMVAVALEALAFDVSAALTAIDLGSGTGFFTEMFLRRFHASKVIAIDGAPAMIDLARGRLGLLADRVTFVTGDFRRLSSFIAAAGWVDAVFSSYAFHHLTAAEKRDVIRQAVGLLKPGGWFINADLVVAGSTQVERRIQELRVEGIVSRAAGKDTRFQDASSTRAFLDEMEANEGDRPLTLSEDLQIVRESGLPAAELLWKEYREVVIGGPKQGAV